MAEHNPKLIDLDYIVHSIKSDEDFYNEYKMKKEHEHVSKISNVKIYDRCSPIDNDLLNSRMKTRIEYLGIDYEKFRDFIIKNKLVIAGSLVLQIISNTYYNNSDIDVISLNNDVHIEYIDKVLNIHNDLNDLNFSLGEKESSFCQDSNRDIFNVSKYVQTSNGKVDIDICFFNDNFEDYRDCINKTYDLDICTNFWDGTNFNFNQESVNNIFENNGIYYIFNKCICEKKLTKRIKKYIDRGYSLNVSCNNILYNVFMFNNVYIIDNSISEHANVCIIGRNYDNNIIIDIRRMYNKTYKKFRYTKNILMCVCLQHIKRIELIVKNLGFVTNNINYIYHKSFDDKDVNIHYKSSIKKIPYGTQIGYYKNETHKKLQYKHKFITNAICASRYLKYDCQELLIVPNCMTIHKIFCRFQCIGCLATYLKLTHGITFDTCTCSSTNHFENVVKNHILDREDIKYLLFNNKTIWKSTNIINKTLRTMVENNMCTCNTYI